MFECGLADIEHLLYANVLNALFVSKYLQVEVKSGSPFLGYFVYPHPFAAYLRFLRFLIL